MTSNQIILKPLAIQRILKNAALFLILASTLGQFIRIFTGHERVYGFIPLFYVDQEVNFPSFFSMFILLSASTLLTIIYVLEKKRFSTYVSYWGTLALGFLLMSIDEIISLHERLTWPIRKLFGAHHAGVFYNAWVIPGISIVILAGVFFYKFLLHLPVNTRRTFLVSASIYLSGVIGMEMIGSIYAEMHGASDLTYLACVTIEESLEMFGVIIFIDGLLEYIADNFTDVLFKILRD